MKRNDLILIIVIVVLGIGALLFINFTKESGSKVGVTVKQEEIASFALDEDIVYTIEGENGAWNTFEIKDGYVNMIDASCPDKLCVSQSKIHYDHETIVCLPNQVVLEIIGGEVNPIDSIAN
ncbi:MAG: NusG domain II-containing protein [Clostridiales bacterium]|nr:NusG domain II-containing protein [Clostridiales bacterium]